MTTDDHDDHDLSVPICDHAWQPVGMLGPYPLETCQMCNTGSILPASGRPDPFDVIIAGLERVGCDPHPAQDDETTP